MTREEYMNRLQEQLEKFGKELQQEILDDYSQHFTEGKAAGRTEEEIIEELGNIDDMIRELKIVESEAVQEDENVRDGAAEACEMEKGGDAKTEGEDMTARTDEAEGGEVTGQPAVSGDQAHRGNYKGVVLKSGVADIVLVQSEDEAVHVDYRNDGSPEEQLKYEFYQYEKEGIFYAGVRKNKNYNDGKQHSFTFGPTTITFRNNFATGSRNENIVVIARVPRSVPEVKMETSSGNMEISKIALQKIKGVTTCGNLQIREAILEKLEITTASGDISCREMTAEKIDATTASGDINLKADAGQYHLVTVSGDVNVMGIKECSEKNVTAGGDISCREMIAEKIDATTASGDINLKKDAGQYHLVTASGDINLSTDAAPEKLETSTASGDINLMCNVEGAEVKVSNRSGDISIRYQGNKTKAKSGQVYTFGDGSCKVSAHSISGNVAIAL